MTVHPATEVIADVADAITIDIRLILPFSGHVRTVVAFVRNGVAITIVDLTFRKGRVVVVAARQARMIVAQPNRTYGYPDLVRVDLAGKTKGCDGNEVAAPEHVREQIEVTARPVLVVATVAEVIALIMTIAVIDEESRIDAQRIEKGGDGATIDLTGTSARG